MATCAAVMTTVRATRVHVFVSVVTAAATVGTSMEWMIAVRARRRHNTERTVNSHAHPVHPLHYPAPGTAPAALVNMVLVCAGARTATGPQTAAWPAQAH